MSVEVKKRSAYKTTMRHRYPYFLVSVLITAVVFCACSSSPKDNGRNRSNSNTTPESTVSPTPTPTPPDEEANVKKLVFDLSSALTRSDVDALGNLYSDGFIMITTTGAISTKPEQIEMIRSGELKFDKMAFEEVGVRAYGNTAVVTALAEALQTYQGKKQSAEARVSFVAVKEGDVWRFVNAQLTPTTAQAHIGTAANSNGNVRTLPPGTANSNPSNK
jgi:ketosteroid isomerase-like protein